MVHWIQHIYRERDEQMIGYLKIIAIRHGKLARSFPDARHLTTIHRWLRLATF